MRNSQNDIEVLSKRLKGCLITILVFEILFGILMFFFNPFWLVGTAITTILVVFGLIGVGSKSRGWLLTYGICHIILMLTTIVLLSFALFGFMAYMNMGSLSSDDFFHHHHHHHHEQSSSSETYSQSSYASASYSSGQPSSSYPSYASSASSQSSYQSSYPSYPSSTDGQSSQSNPSSDYYSSTTSTSGSASASASASASSSASSYPWVWINNNARKIHFDAIHGQTKHNPLGHNHKQMGHNHKQMGHNHKQMGHNHKQMGHNHYSPSASFPYSHSSYGSGSASGHICLLPLILGCSFLLCEFVVFIIKIVSIVQALRLASKIRLATFYSTLLPTTVQQAATSTTYVPPPPPPPAYVEPTKESSLAPVNYPMMHQSVNGAPVYYIAVPQQQAAPTK